MEDKYAVLMLDVSDPIEKRVEEEKKALETILKVYPQFKGKIYSKTNTHAGKYQLIADVIATFDHADILFCNTCGDEIDHLYRFVRAIAKNAGLEIIPVRRLREDISEEEVE